MLYEVMHLLMLEPEMTSIPTAVFYGAESGEYAIGTQAVSAYESGEEGRLMRSINRITSYNVCYTKLLRVCRAVTTETANQQRD